MVTKEVSSDWTYYGVPLWLAEDWDEFAPRQLGWVGFWCQSDMRAAGVDAPSLNLTLFRELYRNECKIKPTLYESWLLDKSEEYIDEERRALMSAYEKWCAANPELAAKIKECEEALKAAGDYLRWGDILQLMQSPLTPSSWRAH